MAEKVVGQGAGVDPGAEEAVEPLQQGRDVAAGQRLDDRPPG